MTLEKLLAQLRADHARLTATISTLEAVMQTPATAAKLVTEVKKGKTPFKYAPGTHWTHTAKGKAILKRNARRAHRQAKKAASSEA